MTRLEQALVDLNQQGYALSSLKQLSGGINSAVFKATGSNNRNYALKLYPLANRNDPRNRCRTEKIFLNYLQACPVQNTPRLLESNISAGWSLISWIEGHKPLHLQPADLQGIAKFIRLINEGSTEATRSQLKPASEACQSLSGLIASIAERLKKLQSTIPSSEISRKGVEWITKIIEPRFKFISRTLLEKRADCSHWGDLHASRIASPSDVGLHNTIRTKHGLYFIDFEYAGLDDFSKLAADWTLQPEHRMDQSQEEIFTKALVTETKGITSESWILRYSDIKPLIHIKWCLIMLNRIHCNDLTKAQLEKTITYFSAM